MFLKNENFKKANQFEELKEKKQYMNNVVIPAFEKAALPADQLKSCASIIKAIECTDCHTMHYAGVHRCKNRWCSICNHHKTLAWIARLLPIIEDFKKNGGYIGKMNFTIENMELTKLKQGINELNASWRYFYNSDSNRKEFKRKYAGGIRSLEVSIGKKKDWHPHLHCLFLRNEFEKDYDWLKHQWELATQKAMKTTEKVGSVYVAGIYEKNGSIIKGVVEIVKYITSADYEWFDLNNSTYLHEAYYALKGVRQISTWGLFYGLAAQVEKDCETMSTKKLEEFICQFCGCTEGQLRDIMYDENLKLRNIPRVYDILKTPKSKKTNSTLIEVTNEVIENEWLHEIEMY